MSQTHRYAGELTASFHTLRWSTWKRREYYSLLSVLFPICKLCCCCCCDIQCAKRQMGLVNHRTKVGWLFLLESQLKHWFTGRIYFSLPYNFICSCNQIRLTSLITVMDYESVNSLKKIEGQTKITTNKYNKVFHLFVQSDRPGESSLQKDCCW